MAVSVSAVTFKVMAELAAPQVPEFLSIHTEGLVRIGTTAGVLASDWWVELACQLEMIGRKRAIFGLTTCKVEWVAVGSAPKVLTRPGREPQDPEAWA